MHFSLLRYVKKGSNSGQWFAARIVTVYNLTVDNREIKNRVGDNTNFWDSWKDISQIENKAIVSILRAKELIIKSVSEDALIAIYIKGSFITREMNKTSDVDIVPIVTESKFENDIFGVNGLEITPVIVVPLSIEEFKNNQLATKSEESVDLRARPDRFLRMINQCRLIYGTALNPNNYPVRSDLEGYKDEIEIIKNGYIPLFLKGEIDFSPLLKEFFWMTEMELSSNGIQAPHTFRGIADVTSTDHLIHEALRLRESDKLDKKSELEFVTRLQESIK